MNEGIKKIMMMNKILHSRYVKDRLYVSRKEGRRRLTGM